MEEEDDTSRPASKPRKVAKEHKDQLERLQEKDDVDTDVEDADMQSDDEILGQDVENGEEKPSIMFSIMSSSVFNEIMLFVLSEMDGI
ncbi:hypothetical protein ACOSP7_017394 [Xanthoceras sorbifolium]